MSFISPPEYNFTSDRNILVNPDQPQTVEQILENGYFVTPTGDPVTAMITDRKHTSWLGLDDTINQIRQRYEIYDKNIEMIELAKCYSVNTFLKHYDQVKPMPVSDRIYYSLNKNLQKFYLQQVEERVTLWRDVSRIRQSLPESAQNYLASCRKVAMLEDNKGDGS